MGLLRAKSRRTGVSTWNDRNAMAGGIGGALGSGLAARRRGRAPSAIIEKLEQRRLLALIAPALSSLPGAAVSLYLDFVGAPAFTWDGQAVHGPGSSTAPIPAFDIDGNGITFTSAELTAIDEVWQVVAEKFSPFNINVTTVDPGNRTHGVTDTVIIGGSNSDWYGGNFGGVSQVGSFTNTGLSNYEFIWTAGLPWGNPYLFNAPIWIGTGVAHEAGHSFGLDHQGVIDGNDNVTVEYSDGNSLEVPIMGNAGNDTASNLNQRGTWWDGPSDSRDSNNNLIYDGTQDDLAILTDAANGFGYRTDDPGVVTMVPNSEGVISGYGGLIIHPATDDDQFVFQATGPNASFTINNAPFGGMLAPTALLTTMGGYPVVFSTNTNTKCTISATGLIPGQTYILNVGSQGGYGDIGQYTITGSLSPFTLYVDSNATHGANNGTNWGNAFLTLQQALNVANSLPMAMPGSLILVAEGDGAYTTTLDGVDGIFQLVDNVAIYGGFAGASDPSAPDDPGLYPTILNGSSGYLNGNFSSYHVLSGDGTNSTAVLEGFTIVGGDASGSGYNELGGGLIDINGSPDISDCIFLNNIAGDGGAIYNDAGSSPQLSNCAFIGNSAILGGAVMNEDDSSPTLINCTFSGNSAVLGGALYNDNNAHPSLTNSILYGDTGNEIENYPDGSSTSVSYSDVEQSGYGGTNIDANPLFVSSTDPQLQNGSPCINTGSSAANAYSTDVLDQLRVVGGYIDMGAYEYQGPFVLYVDENATAGANNGTSWANALLNLKPALLPGYTVYVAQGSYSPNGTTSFSESATFQLQDNLSILGGYEGAANPAAPGTRNVSLYPTILTGSYFLLLHSYSVYHVVTGSGTNSTAILNGFTIENGAAGGSGDNGNGGGLFDNAGSPQIIDCTFTNNSAALGGAVENENYSSPLLVDCTFDNNTATYGGGAVFNEDNSAPYLVNSAFYDNTAANVGGAIYNSYASANLINCTLTANSAPAGGAIYNFYSNLTAANSIFWNDSAPTDSEIDNAAGTTAITYSDIQGGFAGTGNINANPLFTSATNLELLTGSPAVNTGSNSAVAAVLTAGFNTDLAGNPRISNTTVDMGAYESLGPTSLVFAQGPTTANVGSVITPAIVVNLEQNGQIAKGDNSTVTLSLYGNPAGVVLSGTLSESAVQGQATFSGLSINEPGTYQIEATDGSDTAVISAAFSVTSTGGGGTPGLFFATPPSNVTVGNAMSPAVVVDETLNGTLDTADSTSFVTLYTETPGVNNSQTDVATAQVVDGVATFSDLILSSTGTFILVASDGNDGIPTSAPFTVSPVVAPVELFFGAPPFNIYASSTISPGLTVTEEQNGATLTSDSSSFVTLSLIENPSGGTINGTYTAKMVDGVATFNTLTPSAAGVYELGAADGNDLEGAIVFSVATPLVTKLVFTQEPPSSFTLGLNIPLPTFKVSVEQNGVVINDNSTIEVIVDIPNAGAYGGTSYLQAVDGVATFSNYFIGEASPTTLEAFDLTNPGDIPGVSNSFIVNPGPAAGFQANGTGTAGSSASVTVRAFDVANNFASSYSGQVTLTVSDSSDDILDTLTANAQSGIATFNNIILDQAGIYSLDAYDASTGANGYGSLNIYSAAPSQLVFVQQPSTSNAGYPIEPGVTVEVEDQFGNLAGDSSDVTLGIATPGGDQLDGTVTLANGGGYATFTNAIVDQPGAYTLIATDGGLTSAISAPFTVVPPITLYVDQNATGAGTGLDWSDAFTDLQSALAAATPGDSIDVAQGDYSPGADPTDTYQLLDDVTITGGYATGGIAGPDAALYPTILDGLDTNYHVVTADGTDPTAVLQGFTITNGSANGDPYDDSGYGGGLLADGGAPTIENCTFSGNSATYGGGAVYITNETAAAVTLLDCTFTSNTTSSAGGAVYIVDSSPIFVNCLFAANSSSVDGGAIYDNGSSSTFTNCTFTANAAGYYGGAVEEDVASTSTFTNCIFWNDQATDGGSEMNLDDGSSPIVNNSDVAGGYSGNNNLNADPLFLDADGNYQLSDASPAINSGDDNAPGLTGILTDLAGGQRIVGGIIDMGAYENHTFISVVSAQFTIQPTDSLEIQFSDDVSASLAPGALQLTPTLAGNAASPVTVSFNTATDTATFTFSPDVLSGIYTAVLSSAGIQDATGDTMNSNYTFSFLVVNNGDTLALPSGSQTFAVQQIVVGTTAKLDIAGDTLIDQYGSGNTPESEIAAWIGSGFNDGSWNGTGIVSSAAASDSTHATGIGYFDNGPAITISRTWYGDANLDGIINTDDLSLIMLGQAQSGTRWQDGDFIYHNTVNADDWIKLMYAVAVSQGQSLGSYFSSGVIIQRSEKAVFVNPSLANPAQPTFSLTLINQNDDLLDSPQALIQ